MKRAAPFARNYFMLGPARSLTRQLVGDRDVRANLFVGALNADEVGLGQFDRRDFLGVELCAQRRDVERKQLVV